ncbi:MAG: hypothetical protein LBD29_02850 [Treponema sp.]|jgi:hypothetical protein|nr:hypothetical protein [Treponema sp.]
MKKLALVLAAVLTATSGAAAQGWNNSRGYTQSLSIEGTLGLQNGVIALSSGDSVYFVPMLERYVGFIDGLKEGAQVSVEGYAAGYGNVIYPTKLTINGKTYEVSPNPTGMGPYGYGGARSPGYGMGRGHGGYGRGCW